MNTRRRNRWVILIILLILGVVAITKQENLVSFLNDGNQSSALLLSPDSNTEAT